MKEPRRSSRTLTAMTRLIAVALGLWLGAEALNATARAQQQNPPQSPKPEGPNPEIRELAVLNRLAGVWDYEASAKPSESFPKGGRATGTDSSRWVLGGHFLQGRGIPQAQGDKSFAMPNAMWMTTYDLARQSYRMLLFDGGGEFSEWTGQWDEAGRTLTWTSDLPLGLKADSIWKFDDQNDYEYTLVVKDGAGKVYADIMGKLKRKIGAATQPDEAPSPKPASEELKPFAAFAGLWNTETTQKPSIWVKNGGTFKGATRFRWALDGRYLLEESAVADSVGPKTIVMHGFDEPRKSLRCWRFDSSGGIVATTCVWNPAEKTFREQGKIGEIDVEIRFKMTDADALSWTALAKDNKGQIHLDAEGKMMRQR